MTATKRPPGAEEPQLLSEPSAAANEQAAAEWVVRVDRDRTVRTSRALAAWLSDSPRHRAAFLRISLAWRRADALRRVAVPDEEPDPDLLAPDSVRADVLEPARLSSTLRTERRSCKRVALLPRLPAGIAARAAVFAGALRALVGHAFRRQPEAGEQPSLREPGPRRELERDTT